MNCQRHLKPLSLPKPAQVNVPLNSRIFVLDILIAIIDHIGRKK